MTATSHYPVQRNELESGLTVLVKEQHASPVVAVLAHVNVGYFNEPDRWNGLSHVVEHMFFKGTARRPGKEEIAREVRALGGMINAGTYYDQTSYYIVAPSGNVDAAVEILADMFINGLFEEEELAKELEVIIQESNQKRDSPPYLLLQSMYARAYDRHRIRRWRIGDDETLRSFRRRDLVEFIQSTYRPENIVLTIVGDVGTEEVFESVGNHWSGLHRGRLIREVSPDEPPRTGLRYDRMTGNIAQRLVEIGFPAPDLSHPDAAPLMTLGALLSDGRSARLYRALKEEQRLANSAWCSYEGFADLGVLTLGGESVADDPLELEAGLFSEVRRIAEAPISAEELQRVKTRIESRRLYSEEEVLGVARTLAYYEAALGDYRVADETLARLKAVTAEEVQRVADYYFRPEKATILEYLPTEADVPSRTAEEMATHFHGSTAGRAARTMATPYLRDTVCEATVHILGGGAELVHRKRSDLPIVAVFVLFPGGRRGETRLNAGITNLMLKSSLKGTPSLSAEEIANRIEGLGSGIGLTHAPDYFGYSMKILRSRFEEGASILREVLHAPLFSPGEVEREKQSIFGEIRRQMDSMSGRAVDLANEALYGDSSYGLPSAGLHEAVGQVSPEELRRWHSRWVRGQGAVISVVGDISADEALDIMGDIIPAGAAEPGDVVPIALLPPGEKAVEMDRQQTAAVMAFPGVTTYDDDRFALDLLAEVTSGQAGRFFQAVRGENALAYAVSSFHRARREAGSFVTYTATSPGMEEEARQIILSECEKLVSERISVSELADAKEAMAGEQAISLQTFGAQAGELCVNRLLGKPLDSPQVYLARIREQTAEDLQRAASNYLDPKQTWRGVVRGKEA